MITVDGYVIDVAITEEASLKSEPTRFPVEEGGDITDHIIVRPATVVVEGIVSDTPLEPIASLRNADDLPSNEAYARLAEIHTARRLVTIQTSRRRYTNMALVSLTDPRTKDTGASLRFRATFEQLQLVSVSVESEPTFVEIPRAQKKARRRNKPSKEPTPANPPKPKVAQQQKTVLYRLFD